MWALMLGIRDYSRCQLSLQLVTYTEGATSQSRMDQGLPSQMIPYAKDLATTGCSEHGPSP